MGSELQKESIIPEGQPGPIVYVPPPAPTPMSMIAKAVESGASIEMLNGLFALQERWEASEARKAWVQAMSEFKKDPPKITRNKTVGFASKRTNEKTSYDHATLDNVCNTVGPALSAQGLSYRWETVQGEGGIIIVTCYVTHVLGHSEKTTLRGSPDTSGSKNNIQAVGSTVSYLERYTLLSALGLATVDDDDGKGGDGSGGEAITMEQVKTLQDDLFALGADTQAFCVYLDIESLAALPASRLKEAQDALAAKRRAKEKQK